MSQGPAPESATALAPELLEPEPPLPPELEPELRLDVALPVEPEPTDVDELPLAAAVEPEVDPELPLDVVLLPVDPEPAVDPELDDPGLEPELLPVRGVETLLPAAASALGARLELPPDPQPPADRVATATTKNVRVRVNMRLFPAITLTSSL
jgi:hypothetical protein